MATTEQLTLFFLEPDALTGTPGPLHLQESLLLGLSAPARSSLHCWVPSPYYTAWHTVGAQQLWSNQAKGKSPRFWAPLFFSSVGTAISLGVKLEQAEDTAQKTEFSSDANEWKRPPRQPRNWSPGLDLGGDALRPLPAAPDSHFLHYPARHSDEKTPPLLCLLRVTHPPPPPMWRETEPPCPEEGYKIIELVCPKSLSRNMA